jgi:hypothetical protein
VGLGSMTPAFTKDELRKLFGFCSSLMPPGPRPLTAEQLVDLDAILAKTGDLIRSNAGLLARGAKVLEWRLHGKDAPTQNEIRGLAYSNPFALKGKEQRLDTILAAVIAATPGAVVHGNTTRRWVRVTRFSPQQVDDPTAVDSIGGKMPVDALVRAGVLIDDSETFCRREGGSAKTKPKNVNVLVEVFEMAEDEVPDPGPIDAIMPPRKPARRGAITRAVIDGAEQLPSEVVPTKLLGRKRGRVTKVIVEEKSTKPAE